MKKYCLTCPKCGNDECIDAQLHDPSILFCSECEEQLDFEEIRNIIDGWQEYIKDYDEMLKTESDHDEKK